ncbi:MAG: peptidylprolyl isomerase [Gemmatimonadales bacterium]
MRCLRAVRRLIVLRRLPVLLAVAAAGALAGIAACAPAPSLITADVTRLDEPGPDSFVVHVVTSRGPFDIKVHRDWAPRGADRIHYLMLAHYYDGVRFFRVVDKFVAQFGINGDTTVSRVWRARRIDDDSATRSNVRGTLSFAAGGKNTRTTQLFISYGDNSRLDATGFAVVAQVVDGIAVVDALHKGYGEGAPRGQGPEQGRIGREGNAYLIKEFPLLDYIITARIAEEWRRR